MSEDGRWYGMTVEEIKKEIASIKRVRMQGCLNFDYGNGYVCALSAVEGMLADLDAPPVVHGRWIWHEDAEEFECSCCHDRFDYTHTYDLFDHGFQQANFCPNCGAKMDGKDDVK